MIVQPLHKTILSFIAKALLALFALFTITIIMVNILK